MSVTKKEISKRQRKIKQLEEEIKCMKAELNYVKTDTKECLTQLAQILKVLGMNETPTMTFKQIAVACQEPAEIDAKDVPKYEELSDE